MAIFGLIIGFFVPYIILKARSVYISQIIEIKSKRLEAKKRVWDVKSKDLSDMDDNELNKEKYKILEAELINENLEIESKNLEQKNKMLLSNGSLFVVILIGWLLMGCGFYFWYTKIQVYNDKLLELKVEKERKDFNKLDVRQTQRSTYCCDTKNITLSEIYVPTGDTSDKDGAQKRFIT